MYAQIFKNLKNAILKTKTIKMLRNFDLLKTVLMLVQLRVSVSKTLKMYIKFVNRQ